MATATFENGVCIVTGTTTEAATGSSIQVRFSDRVYSGGLIDDQYNYRAVVPLAPDFVGTIEVRLARKPDYLLLDSVTVGELPVDEEDDIPAEEEAAMAEPEPMPEADVEAE